MERVKKGGRRPWTRRPPGWRSTRARSSHVRRPGWQKRARQRLLVLDRPDELFDDRDVGLALLHSDVAENVHLAHLFGFLVLDFVEHGRLPLQIEVVPHVLEVESELRPLVRLVGRLHRRERRVLTRLNVAGAARAAAGKPALHRARDGADGISGADETGETA